MDTALAALVQQCLVHEYNKEYVRELATNREAVEKMAWQSARILLLHYLQTMGYPLPQNWWEKIIKLKPNRTILWVFYPQVPWGP